MGAKTDKHAQPQIAEPGAAVRRREIAPKL
jgi:hypothetical protein